MSRWFEVNFDGLVGPTHNFSGLAYGNIASLLHRDEPSNPRAAALQGLEKMNTIRNLGLMQAVLPPHERPHLTTLRRLGFTGSDAKVLRDVHEKEPWLLMASGSSSAMWAANAATFTPSCDTEDGKAHLTPANLTSNFHRSLEGKVTERILKRIFLDSRFFIVHPPLPEGRYLADEGAANHTRFCHKHGMRGFHLFVFSRSAFHSRLEGPHKYPARQTLEASHSIARLHQIDRRYDLFVQQNPAAVDLGVFHNDVISTGNQNVFFYHEKSFADTPKTIERLQEKFSKACGGDLILAEVKDRDAAVEEAVQTYLFNSQIVTKQDDTMAIIAPAECRENSRVHDVLRKLIEDPALPIEEIHTLDLTESMHNGGGPACLRCRMVLNDHEIAAVKPNIFLDDRLYLQLKDWIERHYRDRLTPDDLADPNLLDESRTALDELTRLLKLGSLYDFQRE